MATEMKRMQLTREIPGRLEERWGVQLLQNKDHMEVGWDELYMITKEKN